MDIRYGIGNISKLRYKLHKLLTSVKKKYKVKPVWNHTKVTKDDIYVYIDLIPELREVDIYFSKGD